MTNKVKPPRACFAERRVMSSLFCKKGGHARMLVNDAIRERCAMARRQWVYVGGRAGNKPSDAEKQAITTACERFIDDVLKPRFLPEIRPTEFNYCVDIFGKWHGNKYRFMQRYRNDHPDRYIEPEFTSPFARLEYVRPDRFDLAYFRHTGEWWPVDRGVSLAEALELLETNGIYHPVV